MTCPELEQLCSTRAPEALPPTARAHLAACPACAAELAADAAADAALRRIGAAPPPVDTDAARAAIRQALARPEPRPRSFMLALAGLAAALALLLAWPAFRPHECSPRVARRAPTPFLPGLPRIQSPGTHPKSKIQTPHPEGTRHPKSKMGPAAPPPRVPNATPAPEPEPNSLKLASAAGASDGGPAAGARSSWPTPTRASRNDLLFLNEGAPLAARPYAPRPLPALPLPALPPVQVRKPGSLVVDDLLSLNPVLVASTGDSGLEGAVRSIAAAEPGVDPRLQQKVYVHANQSLAEVLKALSQATGVQLIPRLEIVDERVSLWEDGRPLMDVMRDLRHLHGYYWSRSKQEGQYVYSLWEDAQSRARDEAEVRRLALEQQREFQESVWKHVRALHADDAELRQLAREDPYLVAQMLHPVVRGGYELFAALAPDQQAQLTQGQTPSRALSAGEVMHVFPLEHQPGDQFSYSPSWIRNMAPLGDIVTLKWKEMTPAQRGATAAIIRGAGVQQARDADKRRRQEPGYDASRTAHELAIAQAMTAADLATATVSLFRWGDPKFEGVSLRLDVQSGGRGWGIYSNIGVPPDTDRSYSDMLRQGQFRLWAGAQAALDRYLGGDQTSRSFPAPAAAAPPPGKKPDPILDAPVSVTWPLVRRLGKYRLSQIEVLTALHRDIPYPLVMDGLPGLLEQTGNGAAEFRWSKQPLRALLARLFPGWECHTDEGAIFLRDPNRLRWRLNQVPRAVSEFLARPGGAYTLDDMALVARSLTPWQIVQLQPYLPDAGIDQLLAAQDLLKLYGELAPAQRAALAQGLPFTALTPIQQAPFLRFAQRERPFMEPWRFQHGGLRLTLGPSAIRDDGRGGPVTVVTRATWVFQFDADDIQTYPLDLFLRTGPAGWEMPLSALIGKPFPGFHSITWRMGGPAADEAIRQPALADARLRHRVEVIVIARPLAELYAGTQPPPDSESWARALAARLQDSGVTVVYEKLAPPALPPHAASGGTHALPNLIELHEMGDINGQPFDSMSVPQQVSQSPTVFVIGSDETVRAVFEGPAAWDTAAVERAARHIVSGPTDTASAPH